MPKKIRLTGRQKKIIREENEHKKLLEVRPTINEVAEVKYLLIQKKIEENQKQIEKLTSAIRGTYLDKQQKEKVLKELKKRVIQQRELYRKIFGMFTIFLRKTYGE